PPRTTLVPYTTLFRSNKVGSVIRRKQAHPDTPFARRKRQDQFGLIARTQREKKVALFRVRQLLKRRDALLDCQRVPRVQGYLKLDRKSTRLNSSHGSI